MTASQKKALANAAVAVIAVATMVKNAIANAVVIVVQKTMMQKKNALAVAVLSTHLM